MNIEFSNILLYNVINKNRRTAERMVDMLAMVSGTVLKSYEVMQKSDGKSVPRIDLYDGDELIKIARVPAVDFYEVGQTVTLQVKIYSNQYGLSVVYFADCTE